MNDEIKVHVVKYGGRPHLVLRWTDPTTGKARCKTSGTSRRREAERAAAKLEKEIGEGQHGPAARMSWMDFRAYHEANCLRALADKTFDAYVVALNVYERFAKPTRLADITTARATAWQTQLRLEGKAEATIAAYTRHLRSVLRWAHSQGLLTNVPKMATPKRAKTAKVMKGRPITAEEFDRMLAALPKVVAPKATKPRDAKVEQSAERRVAELERAKLDKRIVDSWKHYLRGLWWSGLRLSESLVLSWDAVPGALVVDLTGRRPMLRIPAESEKGNQDRLLPIVPEFAEFLQATPEDERVGRVFRLVGRRYGDIRPQPDWVSRVVCAIGRMARVVVDQRERRLLVDARSANAKSKKPKTNPEPDDGIKRKYASAHDLRRAFGLRWSSRVMPAVLQQLMRHDSIDTTMRYYVGRDAEATADAVWATVEKPESNKAGNIDEKTRGDRASKKSQSFGS